jgi:hypothetical protein
MPCLGNPTVKRRKPRSLVSVRTDVAKILGMERQTLRGCPTQRKASGVLRSPAGCRRMEVRVRRWRPGRRSAGRQSSALERRPRGEQFSICVIRSRSTVVTPSPDGHERRNLQLRQSIRARRDHSGGDRMAMGQVNFTSANANQISFQQSGNDLLVDVLGTSNQIRLAGWYANSGDQVVQFVSSDGRKRTAVIAPLRESQFAVLHCQPVDVRIRADPASAMRAPGPSQRAHRSGSIGRGGTCLRFLRGCPPSERSGAARLCCAL